VCLLQPFVHGTWTDPQGTRPEHITLGFYAQEEVALAACRNSAPPLWAEATKGSRCSGCLEEFRSFKGPGHCRNCGQLVCAQCSRSRWPGGMVPPTYHNNERTVRVCDTCHLLALEFRRALKKGDYEAAREVYATGNVNTWMPFMLDGAKEVCDVVYKVRRVCVLPIVSV
jgi:hypothetical protein